MNAEIKREGKEKKEACMAKHGPEKEWENIRKK
jgi:hypothetical protein